MPMIQALKPDALYTRCNTDEFSFEISSDLQDISGLIGQSRALEALHFGTSINKDGYNLFVLGPPGIGKYTMVRQYLEQRSDSLPTPPDWCYVHNFQDPQKPIAIKLASGRGIVFREDVKHLLEDLRTSLPLAFETKEYQVRIQEIEKELEQQRKAAFEQLEQEAKKHHVVILHTPTGFIFAAAKDGKPVSPEEYKAFTEEEKQHFEASIAILQEELNNFIHLVPEFRRQTNNKIKVLNKEVAAFSAGHLIDTLKGKYQDLPAIVHYLNNLQDDVVENINQFRNPEPASDPLSLIMDEEQSFRRYSVNLLIDHNQSRGAPVIYEDNPIYNNLLGRIEHTSRMGVLSTDFTQIKPGALHLANGGFLILDIRKLLIQPYAWEGLKRALYARQIRIQSLAELFSFISMSGLEAEPIPMDLKIVLLGDRHLYYLLLQYDPEFSELFKITAEFEESLERTAENNLLYARVIATLINKEQLLPFDRSAIARIIEFSSRQVNNASKLTTHMLSILDVMRESDQQSREAGIQIVAADHVQQAIDAKIRRVNRLQQELQQEIHSGTILIDTQGEIIGQVNGLSVISLGNHSFALPTRITATTHFGDGQVIDISREVKLGGAIHSKGVLILSSFLSARFASDRPLSLAASITFEQTYGKIEGDSASVGELCSLMSVLADAPVKQSLAVTGSVNQLGQVQAIGGVNEKIEGFFDICKAQGLNGVQGVLIPASNVKHLMLRQDVVAAAEAGKFHIYPITTIDDAISLLTGVKAGVKSKAGKYPKNSINQRINKRIDELNSIRRNFTRH